MSITVAEESNLQFVIDVTDPENPSLMVNLTPIPVSLYVRGSMNDWGNANDAFSLSTGAKALRYQGQNLYTTEIMLPAGSNNFKVADATWDVANFGSAADDATVTLGMPKTLAVGNDSGNISYEAAEAATFLLSVDVTDIEAPVFRLTEQAPYGSEGLFLRGAMFGWDDPSTNPMTYEGSGIYSIDVDLTLENTEPFTYNFKVSGRDWTSPVDFCAPPDSDQVVTLDTEKDLVLKDGDGTNSNLQLTITEADTYIFTVDASDTEAATITVTK
jgi:pullulanase